MKTRRIVPKRRGQGEHSSRLTAGRRAHHFVWYDCSCVEAGSILDQDAERGTWCSNVGAARLLKQSSRQCADVVNSEAAIISTWEQTLDDYAPYMYEFIHLAFPLKEFNTRQAAKDFLARAVGSDDPLGALQPYLEKSVTRVFDITKDSNTRQTHISTTDEEGDEALTAFLAT